MMSNQPIQKNNIVRLISLPTGQTSRELPLTVGNIYIFKYYDGGNVCTTTDEPHLDGHYNRDRVEKVVNTP